MFGSVDQLFSVKILGQHNHLIHYFGYKSIRVLIPHNHNANKIDRVERIAWF